MTYEHLPIAVRSRTAVLERFRNRRTTGYQRAPVRTESVLLLTAFLCLWSFVLPIRAPAQLAIDLRYVALAQDPSADAEDVWIPVPPGVGLVLRYVSQTGFFGEMEGSYGFDRRIGNTCSPNFWSLDGGSPCVEEWIRSSGGLVGVSAGWSLRWNVTPRARLALRPKLTGGVLTSVRRGLETGGFASEDKLAVGIGITVESAVRATRNGPWITISAGADKLTPLGGCFDCFTVFNSPQPPRYNLGVGVAW